MNEKIIRQINQINQRIVEQNDKIVDNISASELRKIDKVKKKLTKEKQKLYGKLYSSDEFEENNDPFCGEDKK